MPRICGSASSRRTLASALSEIPVPIPLPASTSLAVFSSSTTSTSATSAFHPADSSPFTENFTLPFAREKSGYTPNNSAENERISPLTEGLMPNNSYQSASTTCPSVRSNFSSENSSLASMRKPASFTRNSADPASPPLSGVCKVKRSMRIPGIGTNCSTSKDSLFHATVEFRAGQRLPEASVIAPRLSS